MIAYTNYRFDARVRREAETLVAAGCKVRCLTPCVGSRQRTIHSGGVEIEELGAPKYRGKSRFRYCVSYLQFLMSVCLRCTTLLARGMIDAVHVHNMPDFLIAAAILPRVAGKRVVLDIHDSVPETFAGKFNDSARLFFKILCLEERWSARLAHHVICVNHPQREALLARGISEAKTFISMNVPDHRIFCNGISKNEQLQAAPESTLKLVYHGTMTQRLGVDYIIEAVALLKPKIPGIQLHLWGGGDDLPRFQALVRNLRLEGTVCFKPEGWDVSQLPFQLVDMDLGIIGNRKNAATELMLPVKLLEYVALGIPAVAPRLRTIEHYFDSSMLSFYEPENVESMACAIHDLYCRPAVRRVQALKAQSFLTEHGWQNQSREFLNFYSGLLAASKT